MVQKQDAYRRKSMEKLYIGLVDTPGLFAWIIRRVIKQDYIHVVLGLDHDLEECYSVGRRHPAIPLMAGFEKEEKHKIVRAFPAAKYLIYSIECTGEQKEMIRWQLAECYRNRYNYHYCIAGLPFILWKRAFYQKNHYTCSSFIAELLEQHGVLEFQKHFSLVTPKDFYELEQKEVIYEGSLRDICQKEAYGVVQPSA